MSSAAFALTVELVMLCEQLGIQTSLQSQRWEFVITISSLGERTPKILIISFNGRCIVILWTCRSCIKYMLILSSPTLILHSFSCTHHSPGFISHLFVHLCLCIYSLLCTAHASHMHWSMGSLRVVSLTQSVHEQLWMVSSSSSRPIVLWSLHIHSGGFHRLDLIWSQADDLSCCELMHPKVVPRVKILILKVKKMKTTF